jgi:hypothetical protein
MGVDSVKTQYDDFILSGFLTYGFGQYTGWRQSEQRTGGKALFEKLSSIY